MIFDRNKLFHKRKRTIRDDVSPLEIYASERIIESLQPIKNTVSKILNINNANKYISSLLQDIHPNALIFTTEILPDEEYIIDLNNQNFDLIIYSLGLHSINNISEFLNNIKNILKPDGIFIGNFIGHESLKSLRFAMIKAAEFSQNYHNHIYPFIRFDRVTELLQKAGFKEIVADCENINLEYDSPYHLMKAIKKHGESNVMVDSVPYSINKNMLHNLKKNDKSFKDKLNLINFIACVEKGVLKL